VPAVESADRHGLTLAQRKVPGPPWVRECEGVESKSEDHPYSSVRHWEEKKRKARGCDTRYSCREADLAPGVFERKG